MDTDDSDEEEVLLVALSEMQRLNKESIQISALIPEKRLMNGISTTPGKAVKKHIKHYSRFSDSH